MNPPIISVMNTHSNHFLRSYIVLQIIIGGGRSFMIDILFGLILL